MDVREIKEMMPEAEVYSVTPDARYIIVQKRSRIAKGQAEDIANGIFAALGIRCVLIVTDEAPKIFELKE